jgi:beta-glucosidase-like glycosyl hydrolase
MMNFKKLSLSKKLYQLIIHRLDGNQINSSSYRTYIYSLIQKGIGGFILFGGQKDNIRNFILELQSYSEIPLFIASDIERGVGQQVLGCTNFPCQMAIAAAINTNSKEDSLLLESMLKAIATEAHYIGLNMPLIPVLDINLNPDNPIICTRAFSDNPEKVSWFGNKYIKILEENGLISCAKHFPGHGDTSEDSHLNLPVIKKSMNELMNIELKPFKEAIKQGVSSIMIGHLLLPEIDNMPASLSYNVTTNLLCNKMDFNGLVLSDALNMNALKDIENISALCVRAGADILLHPDDPDITVKELLSAIELKIISEQLIDKAVNRILNAKQKMKRIIKNVIDYKFHKELSFQIAEKSITFVKNTKGIIPIEENENISIILAGDEEYFNDCHFKNAFSKVYTLKDIKDIIIKNTEKIIVTIFTSVSAWKGSSGIADIEKDYIRRLIMKSSCSIIISFGSPYVLRHFTDADILIAAYEPSLQAQISVLNCLSGKTKFTGTLPVTLF